MKFKGRSCAAILMLCAVSLSLPGQAQSLESEVLASVSGTWEAARKASLDDMFSNMPPEHSYVMQGAPFWGRDTTRAQYDAMFTGVVRQDIEMTVERVTMLSDTSAVYVAEAFFRQYDAQGAVLLEGPSAITVVLQKREGRWLNLHTHQSFPDS